MSQIPVPPPPPGPAHTRHVRPNKFDAKEAADRAGRLDPLNELRTGRDQVNEVPKWDRIQAAGEAAQGGSFADALAQHKSPYWAGYARELFSKLYGATAEKPLPAEHRPAGSEWVEKLHDAAQTLPEWRALTERARRDPWACGVAAGEALKVIAQQVTPPTEDPAAIQDELDLVKSLMEGQKTTPAHLKRMAALGRQLQGAKEDVGRAVAVLTARQASLRSAMRGAANTAHEAIEEMDAAMGACGGNGTGLASRTNAPPHVLKNELLKNKKFRRIAALAGRMKMAAVSKQRNKARPGAEELCDVTAGGDLRRLIPTEIGNLANPETEALLYRRVLEQSALSYELRGKERQAEGPIIIAIDESGSMSGAPDEWSKAVLFGLLEIGARQKRPVYLVHFDGVVTRTDEFVDPECLDLRAIADAVTYFTGGGTSIGNALMHCAEIIEKAEGPWKRADVIIITDGESGDYDAQTKAIGRMKARGAHLYTVSIGYAASGVLAKESDDNILISSDDIRIGDAAKVSGVFAI